MSRRFSCFLALSIITTSSVSRAGVPSPAESTFPRHILLVGSDPGGVADPAGAITCVARHYGGGNYGYPLFVLDLSSAPDIQLCTTQSDPAVIVDCATRTARWFGDNHGAATVRIEGHATRGATGTHEASAKLFCDGAPFGTIVVATPDEDGNGLGAADNSLWQQDYFGGQYWERSDFDGDGTLGANDLSLWLNVYFPGGSSRNCTANVCP